MEDPECSSVPVCVNSFTTARWSYVQLMILLFPDQLSILVLFKVLPHLTLNLTSKISGGKTAVKFLINKVPLFLWRWKEVYGKLFCDG